MENNETKHLQIQYTKKQAIQMHTPEINYEIFSPLCLLAEKNSRNNDFKSSETRMCLFETNSNKGVYNFY